MSDQTNTFTDVFDYVATDHANTHRSTDGSQQEVDPNWVTEQMKRIEEHGYVIIENVLNDEALEMIRRDVVSRLNQRGRNNFEGEATQRLYAVMAKTMVCNPLVEHPRILALLDQVLEPNYLLSQLQVINILPGERGQLLHADDAFYTWPRPRPPLGAATIWAIDAFREDNGSTVVIPGSHRWGVQTPTDEDTRVKAIMPAGSVLFFVGTLWHGGGANTADTARMCVTAQYCAPWCRQQENFSLSVPWERARLCSPHIQRMLGYSIHKPFMGMVNGMHPLRLLR